jgi:hypothetical protein
MLDQESRRNFIKRMAVGGLDMAAPALTSQAGQAGNPAPARGKGMGQGVLNIKPLGHLDAQDP